MKPSMRAYYPQGLQVKANETTFNININLYFNNL